MNYQNIHTHAYLMLQNLKDLLEKVDDIVMT